MPDQNSPHAPDVAAPSRDSAQPDPEDGAVANPETIAPDHRRWLVIFEDRHGAGAYERLLAELRQPCITFADIAARLGVTRERVRQWQLRLLPDAPRGHQRQQLCAAYRRKRRLLEDPLFRDFFRHARTSVERTRIELIEANDGYRKRSVRIDRRVVALGDARRLDSHPSTIPAYVLRRHGGPAEFHYYRLTPADYLLLPVTELPHVKITFIDDPASPFQAFKNTFEALGSDGAGVIAANEPSHARQSIAIEE